MNVPLPHSETGKPSFERLVSGVHLRVHHSLDSVETAWRSLEEEGICTVYQTFDWCSKWLARVGAARDITACIVTGENALGQILFLLPLQKRRFRGLRLIEALTAPQGAYAGMIFSRDFSSAKIETWIFNHFEDVVAVLPRHDVLRLADVPTSVLHHRNPLLQVRHFVSANQGHVMALQPDYDALLKEKRSSATRRAMRRRDQHLSEQGNLQFDLPQDSLMRVQTLVSMFEHQKARLSEFGVHNVFDPDEEQFIIDLANTQTSEGPFLRPYRLQLDGNTVVVMLGAFRHDTYWALISSLAPGPLRKFSPGDYALRQMFAALCASGAQCLDFAAGDTAYKFHWSDAQISLNLIIRASSALGLLPALAMLCREKLKRIAKRTPILNAFLFGLRRKLKGNSA